MSKLQEREGFGGRLAVILAMAGSAIGLGNIWRFPYMAGEYGGGAFVLVYIVSTLFVSLPVFVSEVVIGRRSCTNARDAFSVLAPKRKFWKMAGILMIIIPTIISSYYSVIGGWSIEYFLKSCMGMLSGGGEIAAEDMFSGFISSTWTPAIMHIIFLSLSAVIVAFGVKSGIEKFSKIFLPILFFLIVFISVYSLRLPGSEAGVRYLFKPQWDLLTPKTMAYALGQSFYSLSLGAGTIITYGSYVNKNENILVSSMGTAFSDLFFALLAGLAIMPAVFAGGMEPGVGPGLIFQSIPFIFSRMSAEFPVFSYIAAITFFFLIIVAAMTSIISLMEVATAFIVEKYDIKRSKAVLIVFFICGLAGIVCSLSFGPLKSLTLAGKNIFEIFDWLSSNVLLVASSLLTIVFVGFVMNKEDVRSEFTNSGSLKFNAKIFNALHFLIKWVALPFVVFIMLTNFLI